MLLVLSMVLMACSGSRGEVGKDADSKNSEPKQELNININTEPPSLHPGLAEDSTSGTVLRQVFEGLSRINLKGKPELAAAENVIISEDQKTYTFTLRDAKWTNGDPVTAMDFEYAWKWALDPANHSAYAYQLYYLEGGQAFNEGTGTADAVGVKAIDDKTLEVKLAKPTPFFLELTAFYTYLPVNSKIAKANPDWANEAGGHYTTNGPFKMTEWSHSDKIVLEKNADYWDAEEVKLEKITMIMVNDANTELSMFENGELDWAGMPTGSLPLDAIPALKDAGTLNTKAIAAIYHYDFNTTAEPFNNANIRKAFALAINRQEIIDNITQGGEVPAMALVPPTMFPENEKGHFKDNDVKKAKEYLQKGLEELGYKDVSELPAINLSFNTHEGHQKIAQALQDMWKKNLGVDVTLDNQEWQVFLDNVQQRNFNIARTGWQGDFNDAINFLEVYYSANAGNNASGWESKEFQDLLDQSEKEQDSKKRQQILMQAEAVIVNEMPFIPLYFYTNNWVQDENLRNVAVSGLGDVQFKWAYFE
nr:peptide ABC transporter substrate-binding protein [Bacillus benzoevorans]